MNKIFFDDKGRLRSGLRALVFLLPFLVLAGMFVVIEESIVSSLSVDTGTASLLFIALNATGLLTLALALGGVVGKLFDHVAFGALGTAFRNAWLSHFLIGMIIGAAAISLAVLVTVLFGGERFEFNRSDSAGVVFGSMCLSFCVFGVSAAWEEAFFRGYIFQTFTRSGLAWFAVGITSLFFGVVHLSNRDATPISTLNTVLAGVVFGLAYLKTRDLWFVWGIHFTWNWMQGSFFGIEVSGITNIAVAPLFKEIDSGPSWLTGTTYGIEGGIACTFALVLSLVLIYYLPIKAAPNAQARTK